jgi:nucleoid-associated protein YgaU
MKINSWSGNSRKLINKDSIYEAFFARTGTTSIEHMGLAFFGNPRDYEFLKDIKKLNHIFSVGDSLSKIAFRHYGDSRYWWVLAWFNAKPTDFHCEIGDIIEIPLPLEEVILKARDRVVL